MSFYFVRLAGEPPIVDSVPQVGDSMTSVELKLDERGMAALKAADALSSVELAHLMGQLVLAGIRIGERAVIPRGAPPRSSSGSPPAS